jgi:hypothetical protein
MVSTTNHAVGTIRVLGVPPFSAIHVISGAFGNLQAGELVWRLQLVAVGE